MKSSTSHSTLRKSADVVDFIVDHYKKVKHIKTFPRRILKDVMPIVFPSSKYEGHGVHKEVYLVRSRRRKLVLKISRKSSTKRDMRVYKRLPENIRNRYFAKIYWHNKYCILQKYGKKVAVPVRELKRLREVAKKYRLGDVKPDNVRKVDGHCKIIDAYPS